MRCPERPSGVVAAADPAFRRDAVGCSAMGSPRKRVSRDAARTREALLDATRWLLTRRGYDQIGVRDIAARAGVDAALVQRYFGSKKRLFEEAIAGAFDLESALESEPNGSLSERLARLCTRKAHRKAELDPKLLFLRSAPSAAVRRSLAQGLDRELVKPLARIAGGRTRALAALAVLTGFDMVHDVLGMGLLGDAEGRRLLEALLEACVERRATRG